ncbi:MAG: IS1634 family transposase [Planctomycetaceae bacterium]
MYLRRCYKVKDGKRHAYWALVESVRTERGPRQRVVAHLGQLEKSAARDLAAGLGPAADSRGTAAGTLFDESHPHWVTVDASRMAVVGCKELGGALLGLDLMHRLGLMEFFQRVMPAGREDVPWPAMAAVLVLCRLLDPSSELHIAEHTYERSALSDLLAVPAAKVNEDRLYRGLDALLPHKEQLQVHLKNRLGQLFQLDYDLILYDVTSTYFEGQADGNPMARRGYSRDHRGDCKQVCIGLVVSRCGMPLGYEVFDGNRSDVTTLQEIVTTMETRYGKANRIWVVDRGMVSQENMEFLKNGCRRYIVGTPKSLLKQYQRQLLEENWQTIRADLEVKLCPSPDGQEVFILCRSGPRRDKEKAMHERFVRRIEQGLLDLQAACIRQRQDPILIAQRLGKLMGKNSRGAGGFQTAVLAGRDGSAWLDWSKDPAWQDWAALSEGCYILRSNVTDWTDHELWEAYIQLTEAEGAFRIHKSDLSLRPIWHQKSERVQAHILVCFLAYVLWKTLGQLCRRADLGDEPRKVLDELSQIQVIDVTVPTRRTDGSTGPLLHKRCISRPTDHQAILLQRLGLNLPSRMKIMPPPLTAS